MINPPSSADPLREQLKRLLQSIDASGRAVLPRLDQDLLTSIVEAAARIFGAAAASIALVDEDEQMLEFKVAYGAGSENIVGLRLSLDCGLAGYVAMTGQAMAVQNVQQDSRFDKDFAQTTGYLPRSILATPLFCGDQVIGVMEVLDKINASSFGMQDMEMLGLFARQAAMAIHLSQQVDGLEGALISGLRRLAQEQASGALLTALDEAEAAPKDETLQAIAEQFQSISQLGEAEQAACLEILSAFQNYARSKHL